MTKLRVDDWVEVRSKEEILQTLDKNGRTDELPFMPQMFQYCGQQFKIFKRAHKTCDTVNQTGGRSLANGIHLDLRCDGDIYGGCQAACLLFWKEVWLKPVGMKNKLTKPVLECMHKLKNESEVNIGCTVEDVLSGTCAKGLQMGDEIVYICQATKLPDFTKLLPWWDFRQYYEDFRSGNASLKKICNGLVYAGFFNLWRGISKKWWSLGVVVTKLYDIVQALSGGFPFPRKEGTIPAEQSTPTSSINLQPGELVRIKSYDEILSTLNVHNKNRGLYFDAEMMPYCGGIYRVRTRLNKFINENAGTLTTLKNPALILEDVYCKARYSDCRLFCPRSIYPWWREIWLERVPEPINQGAESAKNI